MLQIRVKSRSPEFKWFDHVRSVCKLHTSWHLLTLWTWSSHGMANLAKVSMPSCEVFRAAWHCCTNCFKNWFQGISGLRLVLGIFDPCPKAQPDSYKSELLPADVPKMSVEAVTWNWTRNHCMFSNQHMHIMEALQSFQPHRPPALPAGVSSWGAFE